MAGLSRLRHLAAHTLFIRVILVLDPAIIAAGARLISQAYNVLPAEAGGWTPSPLAYSLS